MEENIHKNAELVIKQMKELLDVTLKYDEDSVRWLDDYVAGIRASLDRDVKDNLINVLGSFFGECIRHSYGGAWKQTENGWAISFDDKNAVFPFSKMSKHFEREGESILGLSTSIPVVFKEILQGKSDLAEELDAQEGLHIASRLDMLRIYEYNSRKYRCKGDEYYEIGNQRFSMEYHNLAAEEERRAKEIRRELNDRLGPPGSLLSPGPERMEDMKALAEALPNPWTGDGGQEFDKACFAARYPRWARLIPELWSAQEHWKDDPRFLVQAPYFRPIDPSWRP